jgi:hypothetical protein
MESNARFFFGVTTSARNGNLEVPVYFLILKQGYTIRKMDKKINGYCIY